MKKYENLISQEHDARDEIVSKIIKWMGKYTEIKFDEGMFIQLDWSRFYFESIAIGECGNIFFSYDHAFYDSDWLNIELFNKIYDSITKYPRNKLIFD